MGKRLLHAIPIDLKVAHPAAVSSLFILIWGVSLAFFLSLYALHKRHRVQQVSAYAYLSEKKKKEAQDLLKYQRKYAELELVKLAKQEKEDEIALKREQGAIILERDKQALEKEKLEVEAARLDLERKRAEYVIELARLVTVTFYVGADTDEMRAALIRNALPALKDFGHKEKESTTIILEHLQSMPGDTPRAIPAVTI